MELNRARFLDAFFAARLVVLAIGVALGVLLFPESRWSLLPLVLVAGALGVWLVRTTSGSREGPPALSPGARSG